jgi:hypothetical protein
MSTGTTKRGRPAAVCRGRHLAAPCRCPTRSVPGLDGNIQGHLPEVLAGGTLGRGRGASCSGAGARQDPRRRHRTVVLNRATTIASCCAFDWSPDNRYLFVRRGQLHKPERRTHLVRYRTHPQCAAPERQRHAGHPTTHRHPAHGIPLARANGPMHPHGWQYTLPAEAPPSCHAEPARRGGRRPPS